MCWSEIIKNFILKATSFFVEVFKYAGKLSLWRFVVMSLSDETLRMIFVTLLVIFKDFH